jgi:hypothetical protein
MLQVLLIHSKTSTPTELQPFGNFTLEFFPTVLMGITNEHLFQFVTPA